METAKELIKSSVVVQGTMALMILGTLCYQAMQGIPVSDVLVGFGGTILGYYFGTKAQQSLNNRR